MIAIRPTTHPRRRPTAVLAGLVAIAVVVAACGTPVAADQDGVPAAATRTLVTAAPASPTPPPSPLPATASPTPVVPSAAATAPASPTAATSPTPGATPRPPRRPYAMNLYRAGDYVAQFTNEWCVGASLQMALNITTRKTDASRASQRDLWKMAQARSFSPYGGANPRGWTAALNDLGVGPYVLVSLPGFEEALTVAAEAIRETRRPVGLVMWRGRHAWVMSGFESIGDPAVHDDFEVTGIRVLDPLYPRGSAAWGPSPKPNALIKPSRLAKQFIRRDPSNSTVDLGVPPGWLLVLPTT
jgi:hypothetical protein